MSTLYRRKPINIIAVKKALNKGAFAHTALPAEAQFLPPAFAAELVDTNTQFNQLYTAVGVAKATYRNNNDNLGKAVETLRLAVSHFIQVLNLTIARQAYGFAEPDLRFYSLPDTKVPVLRTEDSVFFWAKNILDGEANRLAALPAATPMNFPSAAEVQAIYTAALALLDEEGRLATRQAEAVQALRKMLSKSRLVVNKLWNFVHNQYLHLPPESRREIMREWGVVYVSRGMQTGITGLVKNTEDQPLEGVVITLQNTGATATTNSEGRYTLHTTFVGSGELLFEYPGKHDVQVLLALPKLQPGTTVEVAVVVMSS